MAMHKYAVMNSENICVNIITIDDEQLPSFHIPDCTLVENDDGHITIYEPQKTAMEIALEEQRIKIDFGHKVVEWFGAENIVLNLDAAAVGYCLQALAGPKAALEAGALETAAYLLSVTSAGPGLSQERIDKYISMIMTRTIE